MDATFDPSELSIFLGSAREGTITDADHARMNELLERSCEAREWQVQYTLLCADLTLLAREDRSAVF